MRLPIASVLRASRPLLPEALAGERAWSRVLSAAGGLPAALTTHYVECRLARDATRVDYMGCGTLDAKSDRAFRDHAWPELPRWQRARALFGAWADEDGPLRQLAPIVWIEIDLDEREVDLPEPRVFFCIDPHLDAGSPVLREPLERA